MKRFFELTFVVAVLGLLLCQAETVNAQSSFQTAVLKDGSGNIVGPVASLTQMFIAVPLQPNEQSVSLYFYKSNDFHSGFEASRGTAGWLSSDCSGTPYLDLGQLPLQTASENDIYTGYIPDLKLTPAVKRLGSYLDPYGQCKRTNFLVFPHAVRAKSLNFGALQVTHPLVVDLVPATSSGRPYVFDANGKVVGPYYYGYYNDHTNSSLAYAYNRTIVRLKPSNVLVSIDIEKAGFTPLTDIPAPYLYYTSADCTGAIYVSPRYLATTPLRSAYVNPDPEQKQLIVFPNGPLASIHIGSVLTTYNMVCRASRPGGNVDLLPLETARIDDQGFTPPFTVKLH